MRRSKQDRRLAAEMSAQRRAALSPSAHLRNLVGWPLAALGIALFVATQVANYSNRILLPFDQHHFVGQVVGLLLAVIGANWATRRK